MLQNCNNPPRVRVLLYVHCVHFWGKLKIFNYIVDKPVPKLYNMYMMIQSLDYLKNIFGAILLRYADYMNPKPLTKPLTEKEEAFVIALVDNKREPLDAFYEAGYTGENESVNKNRSKRIQRHLWLHIEKRIKERVGETATLALNVLEQLMREADSENVRLNAARDILSRAGYDAVQRQETVVKEVHELSEAELDDQIKALMDELGAEGDNIVPFDKDGGKAS